MIERQAPPLSCPAPKLLKALENLVGAISEGQDIDPINSDYFADAVAAIEEAKHND